MEGMATTFFDTITHLISAPFQHFFNLMLAYYLGWVAMFIGACVAGFFLPWNWIRAGLGACLVVGAAYVAGAKRMYDHMKDKE